MKIFHAIIEMYIPYDQDVLIWQGYFSSSVKAEEFIAIEQAKIESNPDKWESHFDGSSTIVVKGKGSYNAGITCITVIE